MNKKITVKTDDLTKGLFAFLASQITVANPQTKRELVEEHKHKSQELQTLQQANTGKFLAFENAEAQIKILIREKEIEIDRLSMAISGYSYRFNSLDFLSWTQKTTDLPAFMVLDPNSENGFKIEIKHFEMSIGTGTWFTPQNLPSAIQDQYQTAVQTLTSIAHRELMDISISAINFGGCPQDTRDKIVRAEKSQLFKNIFIVAEAPEWKINKTLPAHTDPLVIGQHNQDWYLIDWYDPTNLEREILGNFLK